MESSVSFFSPPPSPSVAPIPVASTFELTLCPELDLSVIVSPARTQPKRETKEQARRKTDKKVCFKEAVVVKVTPEPQIPLISDAPPQQPTNCQRRWRDKHHGSQKLKNGAQNQRVEPPTAVSIDHPDSLEEVELNTTLAVKAELLALQGAEFNTHKAIQETLQKVEQMKKQINYKAMQGTNVSRSQTVFTSLVSVDVPESQLISHAIKDRLVLAPPPRSPDNKAAESPSPLIFLTPDLFRQKPLPLDEEPVSSHPIPAPYPASSTFDLYRRRNRWEAAP
ncbi:protein phosphatase 1 regulatory subunit 35 isoform X1 [Syngnathoides biaculeatus]|uniref:protein phosphatase 1 regulatory subunit 35 isoform X1 n=1 Tax=Syngnathoides biaculeatus TaxID=300417 RepID=UPI002ADD8495|nr:protein phosphatase 1 regulatory subunit 35 isoform X1 [Syngnathoides biaculeatus]